MELDLEKLIKRYDFFLLFLLPNNFVFLQTFFKINTLLMKPIFSFSLDDSWNFNIYECSYFCLHNLWKVLLFPVLNDECLFVRINIRQLYLICLITLNLTIDQVNLLWNNNIPNLDLPIYVSFCNPLFLHLL